MSEQTVLAEFVPGLGPVKRPERLKRPTEREPFDPRKIELRFRMAIRRDAYESKIPVLELESYEQPSIYGPLMITLDLLDPEDRKKSIKKSTLHLTHDQAITLAAALIAMCARTSGRSIFAIKDEVLRRTNLVIIEDVRKKRGRE